MSNNTATYIQRMVKIADRAYSETEILEHFPILILLSEPGAGKTEFAKNISENSQHYFKARQLRHQSNIPIAKCVAIDGLDEVAKQGDTILEDLIVKAATIKTDCLILTCRASEWSQSVNEFAKDTFNQPVELGRLVPLSKAEQVRLIDRAYQNIDGPSFIENLRLSGFANLLGNPQLLNLLAAAYNQDISSFSTKLSVFDTGCRYLAKEMRSGTNTQYKPSTESILQLSGQIAALLLLSDGEGISIDESESSVHYPYIISLLTSYERDTCKAAIDTNLFKLGDKISNFTFPHRTIMEYLGAKHLVEALKSHKNRLTLRQLMSMIAPNDIPRRELRGLIGWMITLSSPTEFNMLVKLDPFSVISNADASCRTKTEKEELINNLIDLEGRDPYFRFNQQFQDSSGIFPWLGVEDLEVVTQHLNNPDRSSLVLQIILESFVDNNLLTSLRDDILKLAVNSDLELSIRLLCIKHIASLPLVTVESTCIQLLDNNTTESLDLFCQLFKMSEEIKDIEYVCDKAINTIKMLLPEYNKNIRHKYYLKEYLRNIPYPLQLKVLDNQSRYLESIQNQPAKYFHEPDSPFRTANWVVGVLLDKIFEYNKVICLDRLAQWFSYSEFEHGVSIGRYPSVDYLKNNDEYRREIQWLIALKKSKDSAQSQLLNGLLPFHCHAGIKLSVEDTLILVERAFQEQEFYIWQSFLRYHNSYSKAPDEIRSLMRKHSRENSCLLPMWVNNEKKWRSAKLLEFNREHRNLLRKMKRKTKNVSEINRQFFVNNKALIKSGQHYRANSFIAEYYLLNSGNLLDILPDESFLTLPLINGWKFLQGDIPVWLDFINEYLSNRHRPIISVFYVSCAIRLSHGYSIEGMSDDAIKILLTESRMSFNNIDQKDIEELNQFVTSEFTNRGIEGSEFIIDLVEGKLERLTDDNPYISDLHWLTQYSFLSTPMTELIAKWIYEYSFIPVRSLEQLFQLFIEYYDKKDIVELIETQLNIVGLSNSYDSDDYIKRYLFWLRRAFIYLENLPAKLLGWLACDRDNLMFFESIYSKLHFGDKQNWPSLTAPKIGFLLETYGPLWPKVHLPSHWGTMSPDTETAYRFLKDLPWLIKDEDVLEQISITSKLLNNNKLKDFHKSLKNIKHEANREFTLSRFLPPDLLSVKKFFECQSFPNIEALKAVVHDILSQLQDDIYGSEFNLVDLFLNSDKTHKTENECSSIVGRELLHYLRAYSCNVSLEKNYKDAKRCDINIECFSDGRRLLLPIEAKGQWHSDIFSAAEQQLNNLYLNQPDSQGQGILLIYWFGNGNRIAGKVNKTLNSAKQLKEKLEDALPEHLNKKVSIEVLDLS